MKNLISRLLSAGCLLAACAAVQPLRAQEEILDPFAFENVSLEDMLAMKTAVASLSPASSYRDTPGIVTIITRAEILNSGARNLGDVLAMVPGLAWGYDVQNNLGIGVNGVWANEGKILILLDGQQLNEPLYSTFQEKAVPLDNIKMIEVIRGPGSALYGGNAELGVVKITTLKPSDLQGGLATAWAGRMRGGWFESSMGAYYGKASGKSEFSLHAARNAGLRSDKTYTDFDGNTASFKKDSGFEANNFNLFYGLGGTSLRFIGSKYTNEERDQYGAVLPFTARISFTRLLGELSHETKVSDSLKLTPYYKYAWRKPWKEIDDDWPYNKRVLDNTFGLNADVGAGDLRANAGFVYDAQQVEVYLPDADKGKTAYHNSAVFGQALLGTKLADFTAGARYDKHSKYPSSFVPRFAATKVMGDTHVKLLYSKAFRAPSIENIRLNPEVEPEKTDSVQVETGHRFSDVFFGQVNLFQHRIRKPIIYWNEEVDPDVTPDSGDEYTAEHYDNLGKTGVRGFDLIAKLKSGANSADLSYSFYAKYDNEVEKYDVPGHSGAMLGFAQHTVNLSANFKLSGAANLHPSVSYLNGRYGYVTADTAARLKDAVLANLQLNYKDALGKGLDAGIGVFNVFNTPFKYVQPYNGGQAGIPAPSREIVARLSCAF